MNPATSPLPPDLYEVRSGSSRRHREDKYGHKTSSKHKKLYSETRALDRVARATAREVNAFVLVCVFGGVLGVQRGSKTFGRKTS